MAVSKAVAIGTAAGDECCDAGRRNAAGATGYIKMQRPSRSMGRVMSSAPLWSSNCIYDWRNGTAFTPVSKSTTNIKRHVKRIMAAGWPAHSENVVGPSFFSR